MTDHPPRDAASVARTLHDILLHRAKSWTRGETLHRLLLEALDDAAGDEAGRAQQFEQLLLRVARDVENHPHRELFFQLLRDDRQIRDEDVAGLAEYLHSSVVNNVKGELAELLSRPVLHRFAERLGGGLEIVPGWDVAEPDLRRRGWRKGADALLVTHEGGRLAIAAIVEIKGYHARTGKMEAQIAKHLARLRYGLRVSGRELAPHEYDFLPAGGVRVPAADVPSRVRIPSLSIRTSREELRKPAISRGKFAVAELAFTNRELSYAAYAFAEWFLARLAPLVFHDRNPWPDDPIETAGRHATLEALYHLSLRMRQLQARDDPPRYPRAVDRLFKLYGGMGIGNPTPTGTEMQWLEEDLDPVAQTIEDARDRYRDSDFDEARRLLAKAADLCETEAQNRKIRWLQGMVEYRDVQFARAEGVFPGPSDNPKDIWRHRDAAMTARLAARAGDVELAQWSLADAAAWRWRADDHGISVEIEGVAALIAAMRGDGAAARECSDRAKTARATLARELEENRASHIADPEIDWQALTMGKLDLASALAAAGELDEAEWWIRAITTRQDPWIASYVERDSFLAPVCARVADWLAFQRG